MARSVRNPLPEKLVKEWHPTKNGDLDPKEVAAGSNEKRWWIGVDCPHEWEQVVSKRAKRGQNCPYCSNQRVLEGFNDLATTHPYLASQWSSENTKNATEVIAGSAVKYKWNCSLGHTYEASNASRSRIGSACPYCANKKALPGFNDLATTHPHLLKDWADRKKSPYQVTQGSRYIAEWECSFGHAYKMTVTGKSSGASCPVCLNRKIIKGANGLEHEFPKVASEWDHSKNSIHPSEVASGSPKVYWWICSNGHSYSASPENRTKKSTGCVCQGQRNRVILDGFNDLLTLNPEVAKEWDYEKNEDVPSEVVPGSGKKRWWICKNKHGWMETIAERTKEKRGCPYCNGRLFCQGINDLATTFPEVAKEWDYEKNELSPYEVRVSSDKYYFLCRDNGHSYAASLYHRTSNQSGCPYCFRSRQWSKGERSLYEYIVSIVGAENVVANSKKIISPYELDIYLPSLNLAIEYNGDYWHSEKVISSRKGMSADDYHLRKVEKCSELGITLVFIWDSQWKNNRVELEESVERLILGKFENTDMLPFVTFRSPSSIKEGERLIEELEQREDL